MLPLGGAACSAAFFHEVLLRDAAPSGTGNDYACQACVRVD
jgi:hypothetical protein